MEVLSLGVSRTGTLSMAAAYEILDMPCYHGMRMISDPAEGAHWESAAEATFHGKGEPLTREEWDALLFADFGAVADFSAYFWRELVELYPEAKVVLVERDVERWYVSFTEIAMKALYSPVADFIVKYVETTVGYRSATGSRKMYQGYFCDEDGKPADGLEGIKKNAKAVYRTHYADVRAAVPRERLLNYELGSGWVSGPRCGQFLKHRLQPKRTLLSRV